MATAASTVRCRKARRCDDYICERWIKPGEDYARHVAFPGDDANHGPRPLVIGICQDCQTQYGRGMPPRRNYKRVGGSNDR